MLTIKSLNNDIEQLRNIDDFIQYLNNNFLNIKLFFQSKKVKELHEEKFDLERLLYTLEDNKLISKNNHYVIDEFLILIFYSFEITQFKSAIRTLKPYLSLTKVNYQVDTNIKFLNINNSRIDYHNNFNEIMMLLEKSLLREDATKTLLLYFLVAMKSFSKIGSFTLANDFKLLFLNEKNKYSILQNNTLQIIIDFITIKSNFDIFLELLYNNPLREIIKIQKNNLDTKSKKIISIGINKGEEVNPSLEKIILIDLDGTLIDTAHIQFKPMKDGKITTNLIDIPIFEGAKEFIEYQKSINNQIIIVSDSHYRYVEKIAHDIFDVECISLCDKPNIDKIKKHIENNSQLKKKFIEKKENFIFIGDTWLDIEVGRKLNIPTILVEFYTTNTIEVRDGIGNRLKHINMGATFYAKSFHILNNIIENPTQNILALEGIFHNPIINSIEAVPINEYYTNKNNTRIIALGRQQQGECDKYAIAEQYFNISKIDRSENFIKLLALAIENYIKSSISIKNYDIITFVTDKKTTQPKNKMREIFNNIRIDIDHELLFEWRKNVNGSLRDKSNRQERKIFIQDFLFVRDNINLREKNIIIIDDQITTGATAEILINQLRNKGAKNIIFIGLFSLISNVLSEKKCPKCGKNLIIKIKRVDGNRFFSCVPPKYKGNGCGYTENIKNG